MKWQSWALELPAEASQKANLEKNALQLVFANGQGVHTNVQSISKPCIKREVPESVGNAAPTDYGGKLSVLGLNGFQR